MPWRAAMERALYGEGGFYRREGAAARHFRTSVQVSQSFAGAVGMLLGEVDEALGRPECVDLVDVGAGQGHLLTGVARAVPEELRRRLRLTAVEVVQAPPTTTGDVRWVREPPEDIVGLVIANEWLDNVPVDVVERGPDGLRLILVELQTGVEMAGDRPAAEDLEWLERWWTLAELGERAEVGRPRDEAWADLLRRIRRGVALAMDYGHFADGRPKYGTLAGHRDGRAVPPVPDGSCDITAHVALDACASAFPQGPVRLVRQREALQALEVRGRRPDLEIAVREPERYVAELKRAGEEGELLDPQGLGGFWWLVQGIGLPIPRLLDASMEP